MFNKKIARKTAVLSLALALVLGNTLAVQASSMSPNDNGNQSTSTSGKGSSSSSKGSAAKVPSVTIGGKEVASTVDGISTATNVKGVAVTTPKEFVNAALAVPAGSKAVVNFFRGAPGPEAKKVIDANVQALGVTAGEQIDILAGFNTNGKFEKVITPASPVTFSIGIPDNFMTPGYEYAILCIQEGAVVSVFPNIAEQEGILTFNATGFGSYTIIKAPAGSFRAFR